MAGQVVSQRRRRAEDSGDAVEQARIALKQRQELHAGGQPREQFLEPAERNVRL